MDGSPIRKEVALIVVRPRVVAEVVLVVDIGWEGKVFRLVGRGDTGLSEEVDRDLSILERRANRLEETPGLRRGLARAAEGLPDVAAITSPVRDELAAEDGLNPLCEARWNERSAPTPRPTGGGAGGRGENVLDESTVRLAYLFCSHGTRMRPSAFSLIGKSMSGSFAEDRTVSLSLYWRSRSQRRADPGTSRA